MDKPPEKYAAQSEADIVALVTAHPLAWVVSAGQGFSATPLPLRPRLDAEGRLTALAGHFARSNPQVARLRADPQALMLFMGPHGYVSPSWMADRTQAPTWNYACAAFAGDIVFEEGPEATRAVLDDLIEAMEDGRPAAWRTDDMGPRYEGLARGVVGFRAEIRARRVVFKLGQDERDDVFADIMAALQQQGPQDLARLMDVYAAARE
ncbi:FMN-binding negative transcriptional regulator [Phenylobacterium sp.]|uniref:FMN-binding negative transcriptional regulator n=1 Tax=Phenylobacterium sp. TaxID=1871053 RepID=UPI00273100ED|nr:FMN-binding negative transcriptional regulator [Phenylobacterium sp.]MDP1618670.1 FMN-binding negative transcriptional regulator [Phenylobacterium sp.]MDP1986575.1 FMN-binding negative transcriptional regulator [Phenylobacterium sp.]